MDINPLIYQNPLSDNQNPKSSLLRTWLPRIVILLLVGLVVFQLVRVFGIGSQRSANQPLPLQPASSGTIVLVDQNKTYRVGETISIPVRIITGGHIIQGVDLVIKYDPKFLTAATPALTTSKIMSEYPTNQADPTNKLIRVSGISSVEQVGFNGAGIFGTLNLTAAAKGTTTISVDYSLNSTTDSNMIELATGNDILGLGNSVKININ